jgi:hypothetical protein
MTRRMLKYKISSTESMQTDVLMPRAALIRAVGMQGDHQVYAWAEAAAGDHMFRTFRVIATGGDVPDFGAYLGTVFDGPFVWHIYEMPPA